MMKPHLNRSELFSNEPLHVYPMHQHCVREKIGCVPNQVDALTLHLIVILLEESEIPCSKAVNINDPCNDLYHCLTVVCVHDFTAEY